MFTAIVHSYTVMYSSNAFIPRIGLKSNGAYVAQLLFYPDGQTLPDDAVQDGQYQLRYHLADYANIIDLLRNEKPVRVLYSGSGGGFENTLEVFDEKVGNNDKK